MLHFKKMPLAHGTILFWFAFLAIMEQTRLQVELEDVMPEPQIT